MENDVQHLRHQGLIEQRSIEGHESYSKRVLTLTKRRTQASFASQFIPGGQAIYHGFVNPKEARHDADLYRLYHKVAREIDDVGGNAERFEGVRSFVVGPKWTQIEEGTLLGPISK